MAGKGALAQRTVCRGPAPPPRSHTARTPPLCSRAPQTDLSEEDKALHEKQKAEKAAIKAAADKLKGKK